MPHHPGSRLGVYEITAAIGQGGMGAVYRATDTVLGRQVAIKVLPEIFAADQERVARFEREAKTLAALNHPHIAALYGFERAGGVHALVMEFVDGEDLAQRLARGPVAIDDALPIARQIAEALEAAHDSGIVHRDLKPANIKVRADGTVKVLDFGLAKAMDAGATASASITMPPTLTSPMTQLGVILGTAAYMAPEQAKAKAVDRRADIWAFGAVMFEMLTGARAFPGDDITDTIVAVVSKEPDWSRLPEATPDRVRRLLRRCLIKDPKQRLRDIGEARIALDGAVEPETAASTPAPATVGASWTRGAIAIAAITVASVAAAALAYRAGSSSPTVPSRAIVASLLAEPGNSMPDRLSHPAVSPDGTRVVYPAVDEKGIVALWVRPLANPHATRLSGTEGASYPFWSPDGRSIGFFANDQLVTIDASGGRTRVVCSSAASATGASWGASNDIVIGAAGMLLHANDAGGCKPLPVDVKAVTFMRPTFLPDGRHFIFSSSPESGLGLRVGDLSGGKSVQVVPRGSNPSFVAPDWLLFVDAGLHAVRFDPVRLQSRGDPILVQERIATPGGRANYSASPSVLVAMTEDSDSAGASRLLWADKRGQSQWIEVPQWWGGVSVSPDGRYLAATGFGLWLHDTVRGVTTRENVETVRGAREPMQMPSWSPDGKHLAFRRTIQMAEDRNNTGRRIDLLDVGAGRADVLIAGNGRPVGYPSWFPDGKALAFVMEGDPGARSEVLSISLADRRTQSLFTSPLRIADLVVSPDGRWLAYTTATSDRPDVFVRPVDGQAAPVQVSIAGGEQPRWRRDGAALFFVSPNGAVMEVDAVGTSPLTLSQQRMALEPRAGASITLHDVGPDGQRFLLGTRLRPTSYTLMMNWQSRLERDPR